MQAYIKFMTRFDKLLENLAVLATLGMTIFMTLTVLNRFVLGGILVGCEEWSRICFAWILFFAMGCCSNVGNFASIGLLRQVLPKKGKIVHYVVCQIFGMALCVLFIYYGVRHCINSFGQNYGSISLSASIFMYSSIPAGFLFLLLNCINNIFRAVVMMRGGDVVGELSDEADLSLDINTDEVEKIKHEAEIKREEAENS